MNESEIKALVTLLDDDDHEVVQHVETRLRTLGGSIIPLLEDHWQGNGLNPILQKKIEEETGLSIFKIKDGFYINLSI